MQPTRSLAIRLAVALACGVAVLITACGGRSDSTASASAARATATALSPCGMAAPGSLSYRHVIWLWMENHSYSEVIGSSSAPFLNSLARRCGLATNDHNITHPSLPNYVAATSGLGQSQLDPFRSDCGPSASCSTAAPSIFGQTPSWRAYQESMPAPCPRSDSGTYAVRHNPPLYFRALSGCAQKDLPLPALHSALRRNSLPAFSFVTPNLCNDTHDCSVQTGDGWLAGEVSRIVGSRAYRARQTVLFVTYDEGEGGSSQNCTANRTDSGCRVATVVVSPSTPAGRRSGALYSHYSLLRTTEDLLGLPPLGEAASAASMAKSFGLSR